jgi:hypothetical protein
LRSLEEHIIKHWEDYDVKLSYLHDEKPSIYGILTASIPSPLHAKRQVPQQMDAEEKGNKCIINFGHFCC